MEKKILHSAIYSVLILGVFCSPLMDFGQTVRAAEYIDPSGLYRFWLPEGWRIQAHLSDSMVTVFYGEGVSIFYIEYLGLVQDKDSLALANRIMDVYSSPNGPKNFRWDGGFQQHIVDGEEMTTVSYTFVDEFGEARREIRGLVINDGKGFSITLGDSEQIFDNCVQVFGKIIETWRWNNGN